MFPQFPPSLVCDIKDIKTQEEGEKGPEMQDLDAGRCVSLPQCHSQSSNIWEAGHCTIVSETECHGPGQGQGRHQGLGVRSKQTVPQTDHTCHPILVAHQSQAVMAPAPGVSTAASCAALAASHTGPSPFNIGHRASTTGRQASP